MIWELFIYDMLQIYIIKWYPFVRFWCSDVQSFFLISHVSASLKAAAERALLNRDTGDDHGAEGVGGGVLCQIL